jgi:hypothetical protein
MGSRDVETECFVPLVPHFSAELRNVNQVLYNDAAESSSQSGLNTRRRWYPR